MASVTRVETGVEAGDGAGPGRPLDDLSLCQKTEKSWNVELWVWLVLRP